MELLQDLNEAVEKEVAKFEGRYPSPAMIRTPLVRNVEKMKATQDTIRKELRYANMDRFRRTEVDTQIKQAAAEDLKELLAGERERMAGELAKEKEKWERDRHQNQVRYDREAAAAALRFKAMAPDELKAEAMGLMDHPRMIQPEVLDTLCAEVRTVDPAIHAQLRETIKKESLYEPFKWTDQGRQILKYDKACESCMEAGDTVPVPREDGSISFENLFAVLGPIGGEA